MKTSLAIQAFEDFASIDSLKGYLREVASWGYDAVEPMINNPDLTNSNATVSALENLQLGVSGFRTGLIYQREGFSLTDPQGAVRERAVARLIQCIEYASHFPGACLLNGLIQGPLQEIPAEEASDSFGKVTPSLISVEQADGWIIECLKTCCKESEKRGVGFCLEAVNRYELPYHNTLGEVAAIIGHVESPSLKMLVDTFHMNIEETSPEEAIREHGSHIGAVHLADSNRLAPGLGHINFEEIMRALIDVNYDGYLTVEISHPNIKDAGEAGASKYIKGLLSSD